MQVQLSAWLSGVAISYGDNLRLGDIARAIDSKRGAHRPAPTPSASYRPARSRRARRPAPQSATQPPPRRHSPKKNRPARPASEVTTSATPHTHTNNTSGPNRTLEAPPRTDVQRGWSSTRTPVLKIYAERRNRAVGRGWPDDPLIAAVSPARA